jgi:Tol biopolymer transport system component
MDLQASRDSAKPFQRTLTRLTFDDGLQTGATWSPDGRYIAYSSTRNGKSDIWVQLISGGDAVQITKGPGDNWQPDWSPDGKYIAYRSEVGGGGIYIVPALGGTGLQRKLAPFGYFPRWSSDSSQILFQSSSLPVYNQPYVVKLDGSPPSQVLTEMLKEHFVMYSVWHPDGKRISSWIWDPPDVPAPRFLTGSIDGTQAIESRFPSELQKQIESAAAAEGIAEWRMDFRFGWSPSGQAIYFERTFRGARKYLANDG